MSEKTPVCNYEGSDYQQTFWDTGGRRYEDRAEEIAIRRLMPSGGRRLLELGAGAGRNTPRYKGFEQIVLLDYARSQLEFAQKRLGTSSRYIYVAADAYHLPFAPGAFDGATMIRTLHHMAEPQKVLAQVHAVLQSEGMFLLEFANKRNLKAILRWLMRRQDWNPFDRDPVEYIELNFDFHPAAVRSWLREAGFSVERQLTVSHFRVDLLKKIVPLGLLVGLDSILQWTGPVVQLSPSVFVRSSVEDSTLPSEAGLLWKCPACSSTRMEEEEGALHCKGCGLRWGVRDGIHDFKTPLD